VLRGLDHVAPKRQEYGNGISAPGDVNSRADHDFGGMMTFLAWRRKGKEEANGTRPSCRELLEHPAVPLVDTPFSFRKMPAK